MNELQAQCLKSTLSNNFAYFKILIFIFKAIIFSSAAEGKTVSFGLPILRTTFAHETELLTL